MTTQGVIEALSGAIGESDTDIGGVYMTRLRTLAPKGALTLDVENVIDWPLAGQILLDGVVYHYGSRTDTQLIGIFHMYAGALVAGTARDHSVQSVVADVNRSVTGMDLVRRAMLVDYAESDDLNALGRNLGVLRYPFLSGDDQFRDIIKAIAYTPRGTIYSLELALDAMIGAGNYEIWEDPIHYPCTVFITLIGALGISDYAVGKYYISGCERLYAPTLTSVDLVTTPLRVGGVIMAPEDFITECRNHRPSEDVITEYDGDPGTTLWTFTGFNETADVVPSADYSTFQSSSGGDAVLYGHKIRATITALLYLEWTLSIDALPAGAATNGNYAAVSVDDGMTRVGVGAFKLSGTTYEWRFIAGNGTPISGPPAIGPFTMGTWQSVAVRRVPGQSVEMWIDGALRLSADPALWTTGLNNTIRFGNFTTGAGTSTFRVKQVSVAVYDATEFWDLPLAGSTAGANPTRFTAGSTPFVSGDVGKAFQILDASAVNPQGGSAKGRYTINSFVSSAAVTLKGGAGTAAVVAGVTPTRVVVEDEHAFKYPDDLGKTITLSGSLLGNNGTFTITALREPGTLTNFATYGTPGIEAYTNICEVAAATFVSETGLAWQLLPVFVNDASVDGLLSDAGSVAGTTATLRQALPYPTAVVLARVSRVQTGQLLADANVANYKTNESPLRYLFYPIYLSDPLGYLRQYLDQLTVAGVIPEFRAE
jgi:hypothetical protein